MENWKTQSIGTPGTEKRREMSSACSINDQDTSSRTQPVLSPWKCISIVRMFGEAVMVWGYRTLRLHNYLIKPWVYFHIGTFRYNLLPCRTHSQKQRTKASRTTIVLLPRPYPVDTSQYQPHWEISVDFYQRMLLGPFTHNPIGKWQAFHISCSYHSLYFFIYNAVTQPSAFNKILLWPSLFFQVRIKLFSFVKMDLECPRLSPRLQWRKW